MIMKKHAYLLVIHEYNYVLEILLKCLDYKENDIFIHVDKKTKYFPFEQVEKIVKESKIIFIPRIEVFWGGYTLVEIEIELLKQAKKYGNYTYYHLLSGADLPLKSQEKIHKFFKQNFGKEFIGVESRKFKHYFRVGYYHFEKLNSKRDRIKIFRRIIQHTFVWLQKAIFIKRNKNIKFYKGSQWFSITDNFVNFILGNENYLKKIYKHTFCSDEIFLQTLVMNSKFKNNIYQLKNEDDNKAIMRYIDWNRGAPYVWRKEDFHNLIKSDMLFARKFSDKVDKEIINLIYKSIKNNEEGKDK